MQFYVRCSLAAPQDRYYTKSLYYSVNAVSWEAAGNKANYIALDILKVDLADLHYTVDIMLPIGDKEDYPLITYSRRHGRRGNPRIVHHV